MESQPSRLRLLRGTEHRGPESLLVGPGSDVQRLTREDVGMSIAGAMCTEPPILEHAELH